MKYICIKDFLGHEKGKVYEFEVIQYNTNFFKPFKFEVGDIVSHVLYDGEFELKSGNPVATKPLKVFGGNTMKDRYFNDAGFEDDEFFRQYPVQCIHFIRRPSLEVKEIVEVTRWASDQGISNLANNLPSSCSIMKTVERHNKITITFEK